LHIKWHHIANGNNHLATAVITVTIHMQDDEPPKMLARFKVNISDTLAVFKVVGKHMSLMQSTNYHVLEQLHIVLPFPWPAVRSMNKTSCRLSTWLCTMQHTLYMAIWLLLVHD
jgi:hypothetical protein